MKARRHGSIHPDVVPSDHPGLHGSVSEGLFPADSLFGVLGLRRRVG